MSTREQKPAARILGADGVPLDSSQFINLDAIAADIRAARGLLPAGREALLRGQAEHAPEARMRFDAESGLYLTPEARGATPSASEVTPGGAAHGGGGDGTDDGRGKGPGDEPGDGDSEPGQQGGQVPDVDPAAPGHGEAPVTRQGRTVLQRARTLLTTKAAIASVAAFLLLTGEAIERGIDVQLERAATEEVGTLRRTHPALTPLLGALDMGREAVGVVVAWHERVRVKDDSLKVLFRYGSDEDPARFVVPAESTQDPAAPTIRKRTQEAVDAADAARWRELLPLQPAAGGAAATESITPPSGAAGGQGGTPPSPALPEGRDDGRRRPGRHRR
jgi:hypothetical protein